MRWCLHGNMSIAPMQCGKFHIGYAYVRTGRYGSARARVKSGSFVLQDGMPGSELEYRDNAGMVGKYVNGMVGPMIGNSYDVFDIDFEAEEVQQPIKHLPNGKAAGPDGISGEHLKFSGSMLRTWITQVFNAILSLSSVSLHLLKFPIIPLSTKGKKKTPSIPIVTEE